MISTISFKRGTYSVIKFFRFTEDLILIVLVEIIPYYYFFFKTLTSMLNFLLVSGRISFKFSGIVTFYKYLLIIGKKLHRLLPVASYCPLRNFSGPLVSR